MRATGRHDGGRNRQRVNNPAKILFIAGGVVSGANEGIGIVFAHQGVHVPVTGVDLVAVNRIITSSRIIRVNVLLGVFNVRIAGTAAVSVEVSTRIRVHGVVTNSKTIAIADVILQGIVGFAGKVGLTVVACAPIYTVVAVVAFSILQIAVRVNIEIIGRNRVQSDMCHVVGAVAVMSSLRHVLLNSKGQCDATFLNNIAEQYLHSIFIGSSTTCCRDRNRCAGCGVAYNIRIVVAEIYCLSVPFRVDFQLAICKRERLIFSCCTRRKPIVVQFVCNSPTFGTSRCYL